MNDRALWLLILEILDDLACLFLAARLIEITLLAHVVLLRERASVYLLLNRLVLRHRTRFMKNGSTATSTQD